MKSERKAGDPVEPHEGEEIDVDAPQDQPTNPTGISLGQAAACFFV